MKKHVLFLSVLILCMVVMAACSPSPGYRIYGMAKDSRFEGKTVYLTDMQSNATVLSSRTESSNLQTRWMWQSPIYACSLSRFLTV